MCFKGHCLGKGDGGCERKRSEKELKRFQNDEIKEEGEREKDKRT